VLVGNQQQPSLRSSNPVSLHTDLFLHQAEVRPVGPPRNRPDSYRSHVTSSLSPSVGGVTLVPLPHALCPSEHCLAPNPANHLLFSHRPAPALKVDSSLPSNGKRRKNGENLADALPIWHVVSTRDAHGWAGAGNGRARAVGCQYHEPHTKHVAVKCRLLPERKGVVSHTGHRVTRSYDGV
jgi:hypothetical protein